MKHRLHEQSTTAELLEVNGRQAEDLYMFRKFWPDRIARMIDCFTGAMKGRINYSKFLKIEEKGMPKVSVIIPVYNSKRFVESCIRSLMTQTCGDLEIIIINDEVRTEAVKF